ncbi:hypothetical protein B0A54_13143 [Friedmanniomyces endolithicus]|uniref:Uncharacterized protein n=1 Tax=Friedmanniomyces endolithicus TaxID=329885 RepID=A0A4U0UL20_9PEZI|nr:hypothetical protein B0A54_13143 [Friedmanniomyces endolithicus]
MLPVKSVPRPLTADYVKAIAKYGPRGQRNGLFLVPDILRGLARDNEGRECLKLYDWVAFGGSPLDFETGDAITAMGVRVQSFIGSTDTGLYNILLNDPQDWNMHRFLENNHGFYLSHYHDDLYELAVKRQPDDPRPPFLIDPTADVFYTRDLWRAAPGREGFWMNAGRVDDFVKLSTLTKFNAIAIEQKIEANAIVAKCVIAGDSRKKPFILVEPSAEARPPGILPRPQIPHLPSYNQRTLPRLQKRQNAAGDFFLLV